MLVEARPLMCGIFCGIATAGSIQPSSEIKARLQSRGPDCCQEKSYALPGRASITFVSTVLALRGAEIVPQPVQRGPYSLCWNGEAWSIGGIATNGNDTKAVLDLLVQADAHEINEALTKAEILRLKACLIANLLAQIAGPYAFVFFDSRSNVLYFGRDFLGRRSLLLNQSPLGVIISSIAGASNDLGWSEVEADGVYYLDLSSPFADDQTNIAGKVAYVVNDGHAAAQLPSVIPRLALEKLILPNAAPITEDTASVIELHKVLQAALKTRIDHLPSEPRAATIPLHHSILVPARLAILFSGGLDCTMLARLSHDVLPKSEPIDLLNVVFHNPRVHKDISGSSSPSNAVYEACPDRMTGRSSWEELRKTCPDREWRFVAINVPYQEMLADKEQVISLMQPHDTEMDLSIGLALYSAARGIGTLFREADATHHEYETAAKVLLSGLGADELFGGYTRHATAFRRGGFSCLIDELDLDIARLGKRNLGRDDRVLSHWGRETRFPFLDEDLVRWALSQPVQAKCGFGEVHSPGSIEPGKKVLRCLAARLGMPLVAVEKKRAIQFGARTAKMDTGKTKGTQRLRV